MKKSIVYKNENTITTLSGDEPPTGASLLPLGKLYVASWDGGGPAKYRPATLSDVLNHGLLESPGKVKETVDSMIASTGAERESDFREAARSLGLSSRTVRDRMKKIKGNKNCTK